MGGWISLEGTIVRLLTVLARLKCNHAATPSQSSKSPKLHLVSTFAHPEKVPKQVWSPSEAWGEVNTVGIRNVLVLKIIVKIGCLNIQKLSQKKCFIDTHQFFWEQPWFPRLLL